MLAELPASTVRLIGSGQVITSVYGVVKELFENSVDALATSIDIKLDDYGLERIEVCDNGKGVKSSDVPYMCKRHYTSKLSQMDDLLSIHTYGFRGEALASLCSLADVTVTTKTESDDFSTVYTIDGEGNIKTTKPSHLGKGTTVSARHLFQNLPVRRQYYKSSQRKKDDLRRIEDLLTVFGIIKPSLRISLKHGSSVIFQKLTGSNTKDVLQAVLGRQITNELLQRDKAVAELKATVTAFLPKPGSDVKCLSRASNDRTFVVINDRPVHIKKMVQVLKRYYVNCHSCDSGRYPICYVHISLPSQDVDVNIDPNKSTVFLRPLAELCNSLEEILLEVYRPLDNVPSWHYSESSEAHDKESSKNIPKAQGSKPPGKAWKLPPLPDIDNYGETDSVDKASNPSVNLDRNLNEQNKGLEEFQGDKSQCAPTAATGMDSFDDLLSSSDNQLLLDVLEEGLPTSGDTNLNKTSVADNNNGKENLPLQNTTTAQIIFHQEEPQSIGNKEHMNPSIDELGATSSVKLSNSFIDDSVESVVDSSKTPQISHNVSMSSENTMDTFSDWSKGHMRDSTTGKIIQPVQLLAPTSKHTPGKRPLSPSSEELNRPSPKQRLSSSGIGHIPPHQSTLPGLLNSQTSTALSGPYKQSAPNPAKNSPVQAYENRLKKEKEMSHARNSNLKLSARDQVAAEACQSQAERPKKRSLRQRLYHAEKRVSCTLASMAVAAKHREKLSHERLSFKEPVVLGHADQCEAWFCCHETKLGILNVHRLEETILFQRLRAQHILPTSPLEEPLPLNTRNLSQAQLSELERLARECHQTLRFEITDSRVTANGFDVKWHLDDGNFSAELYGVCNMVPTYGVKDLQELLDMLIENPSRDLDSARPRKVLYYLQGEAARMALQSSSLKSQSQVQDMLKHIKGNILGSEKCFHTTELFSELFDLRELFVQQSPTHEAC